MSTTNNFCRSIGRLGEDLHFLQKNKYQKIKTTKNETEKILVKKVGFI